MGEKFKTNQEIIGLLKGAVILDITVSSWFSAIREMTVEKDGKKFLLSVEANMGYENTPMADIEITDLATQERIF